MTNNNFYEAHAILSALTAVLIELGITEKNEQKHYFDIFSKEYGETLGKVAIAQIEIDIVKELKK